MSSDTLLWQPSDLRRRGTQMHAFMTRCARQHGLAISENSGDAYADYATLHRWSVEHRDLFWSDMIEWAGIRPMQAAEEACRGTGMLGTKWFPGMRLNYAQHLLRHPDFRTAIEAEDELGRRRSLNYGALRELSSRLAAALRAAGVRPGDRVGGFLPNIPETVIGMLATASLGAIWSSCSPDFGVEGVFDRFGQIEPRVLIAADGYSYNGKAIDSLERVAAIVDRIPSIERTIIVPFMNSAPRLERIRGGVLWEAFLAPPCEAVCEPVPFDHPLYIMYSSGTTGVPKCIVHGHGGTLLQHMKELTLHSDLRPDETLFYFTTCGWMMWNWLVSGLGVGATVALYEGSPSYPDLNHLWQFAERIGIQVFGGSPKLFAACEKAGVVPGRAHDLAALRTVLSTGSPLTAENFRWVYQQVKSDLQLASICGGTDIISCFMLGNPMLPVHAGEIQCIGLGMDVQAVDEKGRPQVGRKGELVCRSPFPSQPVGFWNDPNGSKYRKAYFDHYPDVWRHGDYIEITPRGGVIVYGRSDATLNPGGVRIGTAEIYRQVETLEEIVDSVVVGRNTADADVEVCLFVVLRPGRTLDAALESRIRSRIAEGTTRRHVPTHIRQVTAVPYTISGKKVELAVQKMLHGEPVTNRDALANPEALEQYAGIV